jgi:hypothetical protein
LVYIIQGTDLGRFKKAERFGELACLIQRDVFPDDVEERVDTIRGIMTAMLERFEPAKDFLLLTGDPVAIVLAVMVLLCQGIVTIRCLKWDRENQDYYEVELSV